MARSLFSTLLRTFTASLALAVPLADLVQCAPTSAIGAVNVARQATDPAFAGFNIYEETYKTVDNQPITAAILVPKGLKPGRRPVILNIHAGWLVTADALYAPFFPQWALELATKKSAIIVSANHRLLPTKNGLPDPLKDAEDFWQWTRGKLQQALNKRAPGQIADLSRLLLAGGSSGGYLATQLAIAHPYQISLLALNYPWLDLKDHRYTTGPVAGEPNIIHYPPEAVLPKADVVAWINDARQTTVSKAGPERVPYIVGASANGIFYDQILDNKKLNLPEFFPLNRLDAGAKLPCKVWLLHGDQDVTVNIAGSNRFASIVAKKLPGTVLRYDIAVGQDHAFDNDPSTWASFRQAALDFVVAGWLN